MDIGKVAKLAGDRLKDNPVSELVEKSKELVSASQALLETIGPLVDAARNTQQAAERVHRALEAF